MFNMFGSTRFDAQEINLRKRHLYIYDTISTFSVLRVIKTMKALETQKIAPIYLHLNSGGGSCPAGFALISAMRQLQSKIITVVDSEVCSMASLITIAGNERHMVKNGVVMFHDMAGGIGGDYSLKVKDRAVFIEKYFQMLNNHMKKYTDLTDQELLDARSGELWLFADECLAKGVIDKIIE